MRCFLAPCFAYRTVCRQFYRLGWHRRPFLHIFLYIHLLGGHVLMIFTFPH